mgnify:FL=1
MVLRVVQVKLISAHSCIHCSRKTAGKEFFFPLSLILMYLSRRQLCKIIRKERSALKKKTKSMRKSRDDLSSSPGASISMGSQLIEMSHRISENISIETAKETSFRNENVQKIRKLCHVKFFCFCLRNVQNGNQTILHFFH